MVERSMNFELERIWKEMLYLSAWAKENYEELQSG
jgi:hypothetical protein